MPETFIRFVMLARDEESGVEAGLFQRAYSLRDDVNLPPDDRAVISEILNWFEGRLAMPDRFNRTRSKGFHRRAPRGIAWFRATASEHLALAQTLKEILQRHGHVVETVREQRIGYVVYEDEHQVVAEPFAETRTR